MNARSRSARRRLQSAVQAAEWFAERMSIPGVPRLRVIARSDDSTFDTTFDGSPESFARAPLSMMKLTEVHDKLVEDGSATGLTDGDLNVLKRLILEKQQELMKIFVTPTRKRRNTGRHDQYDEVTVPAMARLLEAREKREKRRREHTMRLKMFATRDSRTTQMMLHFLRRSMHAWKTPVRSRRRLQELSSRKCCARSESAATRTER